MSKLEKDEVAFTISLDSSDDLTVKAISDTLRDIETLLEDIEKRVYQYQHAKVKWTWPEEAQLEVVAKVNGLDREQLSKIVKEAQKGFSGVNKPKGPVEWPASFGEVAKKSATNILKRLSTLESITVKADNQRPVKITSARLPEVVLAGASKTTSTYSTVEGVLDLISHRHTLRAAITERGTGNIVQVKFPDELLEEVKRMFKKNVLAEGIVKYRADGTPVSVTLSAPPRERAKGRPLIEYLGAAPDIADGLSPEEFIERIRKDA